MKNFFSVLLLTAGALAQEMPAEPSAGAEWKDDSGVLSDISGGNAMDTGILGSDLVQGAGGIVAIGSDGKVQSVGSGQIMDQSGAGNLIMRIEAPPSFKGWDGTNNSNCGCIGQTGCGCAPKPSCGKCQKLVKVNKCEEKEGLNEFTTNKIQHYQRKVTTVNYKRVYRTETKLEKKWKTITIPVTKLVRKSRKEFKTRIVTSQEPVEFEVELEKELPSTMVPSACNCCSPKCGCSGQSGCGCCSSSCQSQCKPPPPAPAGPVRRTVMTTKTIRRMMPKQKEIKEEVDVPYFERQTRMETKRIEIVVPVTRRIPVTVKEEGFKYVPAQKRVKVNHQVPYMFKECYDEMVEQPTENCSCN